jgi:DNA-binding CsgD family transcriptional regulator
MGLFDGVFEQAVSEIEAIRSVPELKAFLGRLLARYGLKHSVYHGVTLPGVPKTNSILILTYPQQWVERYVEKDYFTVDPVVGAGATSILPIDWATLDKRSPMARQLFGEANELGIGRQGLTFPIRGAVGDHALFTITSDAANAEWEKVRRSYMRDFQVLAHFVHGKVLEFELDEPVLPLKRLSPRERECLNWAAKGKTNKEIARQLSISERVVRGYFESARHKLNCVNRGHVLSRAVSLRIIGPSAE